MATNRLAGETSPYLLQHAYNPVDWYPWGPEALARARELDRPVFLSIGYAACHWCHVMERESFEDPDTAADLNANFVAIKVDREERPDLDAIYMEAVQSMTGGGGWPMSVFLAPDGRPFYGGTYFPREPRYGMPAFRDVLAGVADAWRTRRTEIEAAGSRLAEALGRGAGGGSTDGIGTLGGDVGQAFDRHLLGTALANLERGFDETNGGWGGAPKFPQAMTIEFLLLRFHRTGDPRALAMARRTLDRMAAGGIHDHLGGGFHRYATDAVWLVPHFEKMLYDNALLARAYLHAYQVTAERRYRDVATGTLDFVAREIVVGDDGFAASQDADTDGREGATFVWTADEIESVLRAAGLGEAIEPLRVAYAIAPGGNWEGHTILSRARDDDVVAALVGRSLAETGVLLEAARAALFEARRRRPQPARDDKVLAAWNGLMLGAYADAIRVVRWDGPEGAELAERYRGVAVRAADAVLTHLASADGRLRRSWKDGRASHNGTLEDYTHLADGLLALYEATYLERYFSSARLLVESVLARFRDPAGGFFDTSDDHEALVTRPKSLQDNAIPSGNAMAARVLLRFSAFTGEEQYRSAAERALRLVRDLAPRHPTAFAHWLGAAELAVRPIDEVAIVGSPEAAATRDLVGVVDRFYRPGLVVAVSEGPAASAVPLLANRGAPGGRPTAFVCRNLACLRPVTDPAELAAQLEAR